MLLTVFNILMEKRKQEYLELIEIIPENLHLYSFAALKELSSEKKFRRNEKHLYKYKQNIMLSINSRFFNKDYFEKRELIFIITEELKITRKMLLECISIFNKRKNGSTSTSQKLELMIEGLNDMIYMIQPSI